jgi:alkylation response protein AidB-like acyl-CoA dehydrogenase
VTGMPERVLELIRGAAAGAEEAGRLPDQVVAVLADCGRLRIAVPAEFGGDPCSLPEVVEHLAELAEADASTAWVVMVWMQARIVAARLPEQRFVDLFASGPDVLLGATAAGRGQASAVPGGFEVSGSWGFVSGGSHMRAVLVHCALQPAQGTPRQIGVLLDRDAVTVDELWKVLGLRATSSNGVHADRVRVSSADVYELDGPPNEKATLHSHLPIRPSFALHMGAIALGNAAASLRDWTGPLGQPVADPGAVSADAQLRSILDALQEDLRVCAREIWQAVVRGGQIDADASGRMAAAGARAVHTAADVVAAVYRASGTKVIFDGSPVQRRLRDALTMTQHANVAQGPLIAR